MNSPFIVRDWRPKTFRCHVQSHARKRLNQECHSQQKLAFEGAGAVETVPVNKDWERRGVAGGPAYKKYCRCPLGCNGWQLGSPSAVQSVPLLHLGNLLGAARGRDLSTACLQEKWLCTASHAFPCPRVSVPRLSPDPSWLLCPQDLATLLEQIGCLKYLQVFEEQDVDLRIFLTLTESDLKEIGIT